MAFRRMLHLSDGAEPKDMHMIMIHGTKFRNRIYAGKEKTVFMYFIYTSAPEIDSGTPPVVSELPGAHLLDTIFEEGPRSVTNVVTDEFFEVIKNADVSGLPFVGEAEKKEAYDWMGQTQDAGVHFRTISASAYMREHPEWAKGKKDSEADVPASQIAQSMRELKTIKDIAAYGFMNKLL